VANLTIPKDDLNPIIKLVTRISPKTTTEQNNIRALVKTYWDQFKLEWAGGGTGAGPIAATSCGTT